MLISRRPEQRRQSRARARDIEVPGYYKPRHLSELGQGHCLLWSDRQDEFLRAVCVTAAERPVPVAVVHLEGRGKTMKVTDFSQLRFPAGDPKTTANAQQGNEKS